MKSIQKSILTFLSLFLCTSAIAQELPEKYAFTLGGGLSIPGVDNREGSFFGKHPHSVGYSLNGDFAYFVNPNLGVGFRYDYARYKNSDDKMHVNYIGPQVTMRYLFGDSKQAAFLNIGCGYFDYSERTFDHVRTDKYMSSYYGNRYTKGYFGIAGSLGYQVALSSGVAATFKIDVLTADWFVNPSYSYYNDDYYNIYDDDQPNMFDNNLTFISLGVALTFGK